MAWYQGPSRITVTAVEGRLPQRVVVTARGAAPVEIPGEVGAVHIVEAERWQLDPEHRDQAQWFPNVRAVQGRWQDIRGVLTQVVHSRNRDRAGDRLDHLLERLTGAGHVGQRASRACTSSTWRVIHPCSAAISTARSQCLRASAASPRSYIT
ncbi:hypothetical protein ACIRYZ_29695 [Kitasatospora sp. NPDC101155]|uniref:hypothetical protein n=1 Tax=Kitasatospora sp. NPDC101155 TaxID=3364097 RepID=UPI00382A438B